MGKIFLMFALLIVLVSPVFGAVGVLDQNGNAWNNATTTATVPCAASNDIYLGRIVNVSVLGKYNWVSGAQPIPELWFSVDQTNWYNTGIVFGATSAKDGELHFKGAVVDPSGTWMQLRMCSAVSGLTVTVVGLQQK